MNARWRPRLLMMVLLAALAACGPTPASSPATSPASVPADLVKVLSSLHWLGHASFRLDGPPTVYFDPVVADFQGEPALADMILISHAHSDHYSPDTLRRISGPETAIVAPPQLATQLMADGVPGKVHVLQPGERITLGEVEIEAVPAYNVSRDYHPREAGNLGFVVTWQGRRIYFAGDTDLIPEMAELHPDLALLPVGGTYTMDAQQAMQAAAVLRAQAVVPMHPRGADLQAFRDQCNCGVVLLPEE